MLLPASPTSFWRRSVALALLLQATEAGHGWVVESRAPKTPNARDVARLPRQLATYSPSTGQPSSSTIPYLIRARRSSRGLASTVRLSLFAFASHYSADGHLLGRRTDAASARRTAPTPELTSQPKTVGMFARLVGA